MKRLFMQSVFVVGLLLSSIATASNFPTDEPMGGEPFGHSVKNMGDGLYVFRWWVYRNIFLVTDEGVIVIDPMNPKAANLLLGEIRKITDKPVKYVVYSHNHHDHISGGMVFKDQGATFIAHKNVLKELGDHPSPATPLYMSLRDNNKLSHLYRNRHITRHITKESNYEIKSNHIGAGRLI